MALPDYQDLVPGTPKVWKDSGGDYALTFLSLANSAARQGAKGNFIDATFGNPTVLEILMEIAVAVTIANGVVVELYAGQSDSATAGTDNPANLTGVDAALADPSELKRQADLVGAIQLSAARTTNLQKQRFRFYPTCPYWCPFIVNLSGQALHGSTAQRIQVTPYYSRVKE